MRSHRQQQEADQLKAQVHSLARPSFSPRSMPSRHLGVTWKHSVRSSRLGAVVLSTTRNITSNVTSAAAGTSKGNETAPAPPGEVVIVVSGPGFGMGKVTHAGTAAYSLPADYGPNAGEGTSL